MDRKEFLSLLGLSGASVVMACVGCSKNSGSDTTGPSNVDFTIDISQSPNTALQNSGGYIYNNGVIIARTLAGSFVAVQQTCTHERFNIIYQGSQKRFYCDGHGGTFSESGNVIGGPPPRALKTYNTALNGTILRVYS
jgi:cytochrome b6-f complex iron-sulfur subunit